MKVPMLSPAVALLCMATACAPDLGPGDSQITSTRILAVRAEPAEAAAGAKVTFTALVADPEGTVTNPDLRWSLCTAPKPLTSDNIVSDECLGSSSLVAEGSGPGVTATLPSNACSIFGPDTSSSGLRPRDADPTGGYYQPLRADLAGTPTAFALARIHCNLANADAAQAAAFAAAYRLNQNPRLSALTATVSGRPASFAGIPAGARIVLEASWPADSAETFAYYDPVSQTVTMQREAMQVAWYATGGALDTESTGRSASDPATTTDDGWTAPNMPGVVHLWIVLRDSRGGIDTAPQDVVVVP